MFRNVNSSSQLIRIICFCSNSGSCLEWYSELPCDDSLLDSYSEVSLEFCSDDDMASIQGSGTLAVCLYPRIFVLVEFWIRNAVNGMGETILAQVCCLRCDQGHCQ